MKKLALAFGLFIFCAGLGWFAAPSLPRAQALRAPVPVKPVPVAAKPLARTEPSPLPELLLHAKGGPLFAALFDENVLEGTNFRELEPALSARFRREYPRDEAEAHRELVSRMGILKAMFSEFTEDNAGDEKAALFNFYRNLALRPREHFLVKRQAVRNISAWLKFYPEQKRRELITRLPAAVVSAANLTEAEILEEVMHAH